ncbi:MAG: acetyl-CoA carboxylase biotin carboxylase subunit [Thermoguttaceae bacterium]|nr:acetyl-CoA carboxylase biotin carboxylase subunit [Thermoguttaceae bacterium]
MFKRVLIANRGEIALRVIRACHELGVEAVVVCSEADRDARYVKLADRSVCIGPARSAQSYLKINQIISAAELVEADAIHPGYGFLSENADFNEICRSCGYEFVGPTVEAMQSLGDKNAARAMAKRCGVPTIPGSDGLVKTEAEALKVAHEVGYPVLVKASAGGGGRGIRQANDDDELRRVLSEAAEEARVAFGNPDVYIEKFIKKSRHVEAQILADNYGNVVHLWERDCSLQRRRQKLVELTPAPGFSLAKRKALCESAARLAREANYTNAGTVEFVVDENFNFYFIEMNARIQVEHPVTEAATGIDLIKAQLRVAAGEKLWFSQKDVKHCGFAMECRINAEDVENNCRPSPGKIEQLIVPGGFGVRFDSHVYPGYTVSPYYDSMIGKLLTYASTREEGLAIMKRALAEMEISGVKTSIPLLQRILHSEEFQTEIPDVGFIERNFMNR